jgi:hypothetical protein
MLIKYCCKSTLCYDNFWEPLNPTFYNSKKLPCRLILVIDLVITGNQIIKNAGKLKADVVVVV